MSTLHTGLLPRRQLQALDLRTNYAEPHYRCPEEEFSDGDPRIPPAMARPAAYLRMDQPKLPELRFNRMATSSDPSITQSTLSRSWSMIDLHTPRGTPTMRLRGGADTFGYDNLEEDTRNFYRSVDPSVEYDEPEYNPIPRRNPHRRNLVRRLRAGLQHSDCPDQNNYSQSPNYSQFQQRQQCPPPCGPPQSTPYGNAGMHQRPESYSEQYSSIPPRPPSMSPIGPGSPWVPPSPQCTPPSQDISMSRRSSMQGRSPSRQQFYQQNSSPWGQRRPQQTPPSAQMNNQYSACPPYSNTYSSGPMQTPVSRRVPGLVGRPMSAPPRPPQPTWLTPPGLYYSGSMQTTQQSTLQSQLSQQLRSPMQQSMSPTQMPMQNSGNWDGRAMPQQLAQTPCSFTTPKPCPDPNKKAEDPEEKCPTKERLPYSCTETPANEEVSAPSKVLCTPLNPRIAAKLDPSLPPFKVPPGKEEEFDCTKRREQWDALIKDQYCPGVIQDTIDNVVDFNVLAMDIIFGNSRISDCSPRVEPLTLMEAFYMRINFERCQVHKLEDATKAGGAEEEDQQPKADKPDDTTLIDKCFKRKHQTDLNTAIRQFLIAEKMYKTENPNPEQPLMNMMVDKTVAAVPGVPISIQAFTGTTQPLEK